jgi:hypothetical protein
MRMAGSAKNLRLKNPVRRAAKRKKTEMKRRRTKNNPRLYATCTCKMRKPCIITQSKRTAFQDTGALI